MDDFVVFHYTFWVCCFKNRVRVNTIDLVAVNGSFVDRDHCDGPVRGGLQSILSHLELNDTNNTSTLFNGRESI